MMNRPIAPGLAMPAGAAPGAGSGPRSADFYCESKF